MPLAPLTLKVPHKAEQHPQHCCQSGTDTSILQVGRNGGGMGSPNPPSTARARDCGGPCVLLMLSRPCWFVVWSAEMGTGCPCLNVTCPVQGHLCCARGPRASQLLAAVTAQQISKTKMQERTDPGCSKDVWEQPNCSCTPGYDLSGAPVLAGTRGWLLALTPPEQPRVLLGALDKCPVCSCLEPGSH